MKTIWRLFWQLIFTLSIFGLISTFLRGKK